MKLNLKFYLSHGAGRNWSDWLGEFVLTPEEADLIVFSGGADVSPELYNSPKHPYTYNDITRDAKEVALYGKALDLKKPMLGVCRGSQFLTVMNGGSLIQHVTNHTRDHDIETLDGDIYKVTSTHHQMMHLDNTSGILLAWANKLSPIHQDGTMSDINVEKEPEIVYYPDTNVLCIQSHPEFPHYDAASKNYINHLIKTYLFDA